MNEAGEVLGDQDLSYDKDALTLVLKEIRVVAGQSLKPKHSIRMRSMKRILKLFQKASQSNSAAARETFDVPMELLSFIRLNLPEGTQVEGFLPEQRDLLQFLADFAEPNDLLQALARMEGLSGYIPSVLPIVRTLLRRAAHESVSSELSVALMKVKYARMDMEDGIEGSRNLEGSPGVVPSTTIWQMMSHGMITITK